MHGGIAMSDDGLLDQHVIETACKRAYDLLPEVISRREGVPISHLPFPNTDGKIEPIPIRTLFSDGSPQPYVIPLFLFEAAFHALGQMLGTFTSHQLEQVHRRLYATQLQAYKHACGYVDEQGNPTAKWVAFDDLQRRMKELGDQIGRVGLDGVDEDLEAPSDT